MREPSHAAASPIGSTVRLHAVCVLSNHLHLVVRDEGAELAAWAGYWLGTLARAVNRLRRGSGTFFERRYSAEPILDDEALCERARPSPSSRRALQGPEVLRPL